MQLALSIARETLCGYSARRFACSFLSSRLSVNINTIYWYEYVAFYCQMFRSCFRLVGILNYLIAADKRHRMVSRNLRAALFQCHDYESL